jgi:hypothetical protein
MADGAVGSMYQFYLDSTLLAKIITSASAIRIVENKAKKIGKSLMVDAKR